MAARAFRASEDAAARGRSGEAARLLAVAIFLRDIGNASSIYMVPQFWDDDPS